MYYHLFSYAKDASDPVRSALPISGNAINANSTVQEFIDTIGYDTIIAGGLQDSWRHEPQTPIYLFPYASVSPLNLSTQTEWQEWFFSSAPRKVSKATVQELLHQATRERIGGIPTPGNIFPPPLGVKFYPFPNGK